MWWTHQGFRGTGIELMDQSLLSSLNQARAAREPTVVVTHLTSGAKRLLNAQNVTTDPLGEAISSRLKSGKSGIEPSNNGDHFIQVYLPSVRLVLIGAVHISQALAPMAQACGYDLTIIDPRTAFATPERFEGYALHPEWPQEIMSVGYLDPFTALVAVTHDPKIDDIPLKMALDAGCFYVGALGGRNTNVKREKRLLEAGASQQAIDRIHAPIGLDIGAATPAEIAVAIMAEIIEAQRKPSAHGDQS